MQRARHRQMDGPPQKVLLLYKLRSNKKTVAETADIAKMAEEVSRRIFSIFGWERRPHRDRNWPCTAPEHKKKTHPSDVVFSYDSPVEPNRIFLNTDLKSYARSSITKDGVEKALQSLSLAVDCANRNEHWQQLYANPELGYHVHGLLFIYNHDGGYDKDFDNLLADVKLSLLKMKGKNRLYVFGPRQIEYLDMVAYDIQFSRGQEDEGRLPPSSQCHFFHPDLVRARVTTKTLKAATAEMLLAPWLVLQYEAPSESSDHLGYLIYYREDCSSADELKFLLDYLFRFQLVGDRNKIQIRAPFAVSNATAIFETAKEQYAKDYFDFPEFKKRLERISLRSIPRVNSSFSETQMGLD